MFVEVQDINLLKMAFSIIEFLTKIIIGLFVGGLISAPIVYIIWKRKMKKIRKSIPENMEEKIKEFKEIERRTEDEKRKQEGLKRTRRDQRAADTIKSNNGIPVKNLRRRSIIEGSREIPKTTPDSIKRTKPSSKGDWPSFE